MWLHEVKDIAIVLRDYRFRDYNYFIILSIKLNSNMFDLECLDL